MEFYRHTLALLASKEQTESPFYMTSPEVTLRK
jgi:hypothetical protein